MTRRHLSTIMLTAPALLIGMSAIAQTSTQPQQPRNPDATQQRPVRPQDDTMNARQLRNSQLNFVTFDKAKGMDVLSISEEKLGDVSNLIVERGSGRIAFVILDHGGTLGVGENSVAIPYHAFNIETAGEDVRLRIDMSPSDLENAPEFDAEKWQGLDQTKWTDDLKQFWSNTVAWWNDEDPRQWRDAYTTGKSETIKGEIVEVRRMDEHRPENVALMIRTKDSETPRTVYLGPSWYVMTYNEIPQRGETVMITAVPVTDARREGAYVANTIEYDNGKKLNLRDEKGTSQWNAANAAANHSAPRYVLADTLINADVKDSTGAPSGHIDNLFIECSRGQVAFVGIDPDDKLADIGEVNRIVPFEIVQVVGRDNIHIATTLDRLRTSVETPDKASALNSPQLRSQIYNEFNTTERRYSSVGAERDRDTDMDRTPRRPDRPGMNDPNNPNNNNNPGGTNRP